MLQHLEDFILPVMHRKPLGRLPSAQIVKQLYQELNALDLRDFEPAARFPLLKVRGMLAHFSQTTGWSDEVMVETLWELHPLLKQYRGKGTGAVQQSFAYVCDLDLRAIIERDYAELTLKLFPSGAWKSTVILAGSILEAILFDRLADPKWHSAAVACPASRTTTGASIPPDKWTLEKLIDIAVDITLLPADPANTIHQVLRDYRNFVHPRKEIRAAHACTDAEAMLAVGALKSVCNYIEKNP